MRDKDGELWWDAREKGAEAIWFVRPTFRALYEISYVLQYKIETLQSWDTCINKLCKTVSTFSLGVNKEISEKGNDSCCWSSDHSDVSKNKPNFGFLLFDHIAKRNLRPKSRLLWHFGFFFCLYKLVQAQKCLVQVYCDAGMSLRRCAWY